MNQINSNCNISLYLAEPPLKPPLDKKKNKMEMECKTVGDMIMKWAIYKYSNVI